PLAVGQGDHLGRPAQRHRLGDRAARAPHEVGRVRTDDLDPPAHTPATLRVLATAIVRTSSSLNPASRCMSAMIASPSSTGGLNPCPRSVAHVVRSAPTARVASNTWSHVHLPVYGVVNARSISAPLSASATWSAGAILCDGNSG